MVEVLGYILVAVNLAPNGDVEGSALDYFRHNVVCYSVAVELEAQAPPGVGYVCLEDYISQDE
jgi:hypothetical protein